MTQTPPNDVAGLVARIDAEIARITGWHPAKEILAECRQALTPAPLAQEGELVVVPREPTEAMMNAYFDRCRERGFTFHINATAAWSAMLAAAPTPQPASVVAGEREAALIEAAEVMFLTRDYIPAGPLLERARKAESAIRATLQQAQSTPVAPEGDLREALEGDHKPKLGEGEYAYLTRERLPLVLREQAKDALFFEAEPHVVIDAWNIIQIAADELASPPPVDAGGGLGLPADVARLVIAARMVAWEDPDPANTKELQAASEAFADRVPWDDQPEDEE